MDGVPIVNDLPNLDAPLIPLTLLFHKFLLVGAGTRELIIEGMKVYGEDAVFGAVPAHLGWLHSHNLAASLYYS